MTSCFLMVQDQREIVPPNAETATAATGADSAAAATAVTHGIEVAVEFKPVEHPTEPFDNDQPVQCPLPEPSILNVSFIFRLFSKLSGCLDTN